MDPVRALGRPLRLHISEQVDTLVCVVNVFLPLTKYHDLPTYLVKQITPAAHERDNMPPRKREMMDTHLHKCGLITKYLPAALTLPGRGKLMWWSHAETHCSG